MNSSKLTAITYKKLGEGIRSIINKQIKNAFCMSNQIEG